MKSVKAAMSELLSVLALLLIGIWLIYSSAIDTPVGNAVLDKMKTTPAIGITIGAVLICVVLFRLITLGGSRDKTHFLTFDSENGSVGISSKAVRDFIERVGHEFAGIKSMESTLIMDKGALDVELRVKVKVGNRIPELSHVLQARVRESVREALGLEEIRNIKIKVQEIVGEPTKPVESGNSE
ncbi:MAG: alkaline shock response membrane anchor protein AmaP [Kiritimatiellales bacterium]|nr:alkaline shock response membrane anchor protein AmaP [Kiritimatiellales bacterium]